MQELESRELRHAVAAAQATLDKVAILAGICPPDVRGITLLSVAKRLASERRERVTCFPQDILGEPAWDILLGLYIARCEEQRLSIGEACRIARVGDARGRRLLDRLEARGLIVRRLSPGSGKIWLVELAREAEDRMSDYLMRLL